MANYIDGFVLPISRDHLDEYKRLVEAVAVIWKEHGALDYREYVGDDLMLNGWHTVVSSRSLFDRALFFTRPTVERFRIRGRNCDPLISS